jgi:hypothetical protein
MKKTTAQIVRNELKKANLIGLPGKVDSLSNRMDEMADAARIIRENEQNLKDLGGLKGRLDLLDKIYVKIDKIAGEVTSYREQQELNSDKLIKHDDRIGKVEKHLHLPATT